MLSALAMTLVLTARPVTVHLPQPEAGALALHCVQPGGRMTDDNADARAVLFIHGASFPTRLAAGFEFAPGDSWLHDAARKNHLACGLDFSGFGASASPDALLQPAQNASPAVTSTDAVAQIATAVGYLRDARQATRIHLVAHSWGTVPAARFAAEHPDALASLTLFGPVVPTGAPWPDEMLPAWYPLSATERYEQLKYKTVLPAGADLLEPAVHARWADEFSAAARAEISAGGVLRIPAGPLADVAAVQSGTLPFDPAHVRAPLMIVYGNHDTVVNRSNAGPFLDRFTRSPLKWQLQLNDGTHVMHLERNRRSLYAAVNAFIATVDAR